LLSSPAFDSTPNSRSLGQPATISIELSAFGTRVREIPVDYIDVAGVRTLGPVTGAGLGTTRTVEWTPHRATDQGILIVGDQSVDVVVVEPPASFDAAVEMDAQAGQGDAPEEPQFTDDVIEGDDGGEE
jgi:hypothetical protein